MLHCGTLLFTRDFQGMIQIPKILSHPENQMKCCYEQAKDLEGAISTLQAVQCGKEDGLPAQGGVIAGG